jgi:hypothetical protein
VTARPWRDDGYTGDLSNPWNLDNNQPNPDFLFSEENRKNKQELSKILEQSFKRKERALEEFKTKLAPHHALISGEYVNVKSPIKIWCSSCKKMNDTTFTNYTKSRHGTKCCGDKQRISKAKNYSKDSKGRFRDSKRGS